MARSEVRFHNVPKVQHRDVTPQGLDYKCRRLGWGEHETSQLIIALEKSPEPQGISLAMKLFLCRLSNFFLHC